jgi:hypothetical protein
MSNTLTWGEFINKIKEFKSAGVKSGLNAPSIIRLLYSGAFDALLPKELFEIPATKRYAQLIQEALKAMGSKAKLPKKGARELIGLQSVDSPSHLMLWRHSINPFARYDMTEYYVTFLKTMGFTRPTDVDRIADPGLLWVRYPDENTHHKIRVDIRRSWAGTFHPSVYQKYGQGGRLVGVVGIIIKSQKRMYQETKESLSIMMFNGHEHTNEMKMWPGKDGLLDRGKMLQMAELSMGLMIVQPKFWNNKPTATVFSWDKIWGN